MLHSSHEQTQRKESQSMNDESTIAMNDISLHSCTVEIAGYLLGACSSTQECVRLEGIPGCFNAGLNTVPNKPIKYETIHIVHSNYIVLFAYIHRSIHPPIHIGNICICVSHILNLLIESWCFLEMSGVGGGQMGSRSRTVGMPPGPFWRSLNAYNLLVRST